VKRTAIPAALLLLALALAGCGSTKVGPDSTDMRGAALDCLTNKHRLQARMSGTDSIQVGNAQTGPRIRFFLTRGLAEAEQFGGDAEGTIQSGSALIYVRRNGDTVLKQVEDCIDNL
jgi:hypothetical protein